MKRKRRKAGQLPQVIQASFLMEAAMSKESEREELEQNSRNYNDGRQDGLKGRPYTGKEYGWYRAGYIEGQAKRLREQGEE